MGEPVSVALSWMNFALDNSTVLYGAIGSVVNVYYDMDSALLKTLFLESNAVDYFNYANHRVFQSLDVAKFTTLEVPSVQMQDAALAYVAAQTGYTLSEVTNRSEWLSAFRAAMETQLTLLDGKALEKDMGSGPAFAEITPPITMSRNATTDYVYVNGATFTSKPILAGDIFYFDVLCTFTGTIAAQTYRINLRARESFVQDYPLKFLPAPAVSPVYMYLCAPNLVTDQTAWTVNDAAIYPFRHGVYALSGVNILTHLSLYLLFSSSPLTIGSNVPAGVSMTGDLALVHWLMSGTSSRFEALPSTSLKMKVRTQNEVLNASVASYSQLTTQEKIVLSFPSEFELLDDRVYDSGTAYTALDLRRQQPYPSQKLVYFQCVQAVASAFEGYYFEIPTGELTVTVQAAGGSATYDLAAIEAGTYEFIKKKENWIYVLADGVVFPAATVTASNPAVVVKSCVINRDGYVAVAPLPVTEEPDFAAAAFDSAFLEIADLFAYTLDAPFALTADEIQYAINHSETGFYCRIIERGAYRFLQIEHPASFVVEAWDLAGFHEARVSQPMTAAVRARLSVDANGGAGSYSLLYDVGSSVASLDASPISNGSAVLAGFNTQADGQGEAFAAFNLTQNTTFYAQWTSSVTYTVTYTGAGATGSQSDSTVYHLNDVVTLLGPGTMQLTDHLFTVWKSGTKYYFEGAKYVIQSNVVFDAIWHNQTIPGTSVYGVTYDKNSPNATGDPPPDVLTNTGDYYTIEGQGTMLLTNSVFLGWRNSSGDFFEVGWTYKFNMFLQLYAEWDPPDSADY